jgi:hypothetical protein
VCSACLKLARTFAGFGCAGFGNLCQLELFEVFESHIGSGCISSCCVAAQLLPGDQVLPSVLQQRPLYDGHRTYGAMFLAL